MYKFGINSEDSLIMDIDSKYVYKNIIKEFETADEEILNVKIKEVIKKPKEFNNLCERLNIEQTEVFLILNNLFPKIFTKRTLNSITRLYNKHAIQIREEKRAAKAREKAARKKKKKK